MSPGGPGREAMTNDTPKGVGTEAKPRDQYAL
jgi:hypothetical protein